MPVKEYYQKNLERCREYARKRRQEKGQKRYNDLEKNRQAAARWLENPDNRAKKILYLKDYNKSRTKQEKKGRKDFCEMCKIDIPEILDSHHIIPRSLGGSDKKENKITVCANCHRFIHAGLIELSSEKGLTIGEKR